MMTHEYTNSEILVGDPLFEQVMRLRGDVLDKTVNAKAQAYPTDGDKNPANRHFVTTCHDDVVATVRFDTQPDGSALVRRMAVDPMYRRKGIGKALLLFGEQAVKQRGVSVCTLHSRMGAIDFYTSLGYKKDGNVYIAENDKNIGMVKELA